MKDIEAELKFKLGIGKKIEAVFDECLRKFGIPA
jgi:hypothetical protein